MTKLLLIRHGESEANNKGFFAGQYDAPLMPKGVEQAEKTAKYAVEKYHPVKIYASDLKRAYDTAIPVSKLIDADIITDQRIREIYAGKWQQMPFDDLEKTYPDDYRVWLNDIGNACCSGGESVKELSERVMAALTDIAKENDGETVAVATHATPIRAAQTVIQHGDIGYMKNVPWVSNGSVTVLEYNGEWRCASVSEDHHLGAYKTVFPANV